MRAWIENQYGDVCAQLEVVEEDEFNISDEDWLCLKPVFLCEGDSWIVKADSNKKESD